MITSNTFLVIALLVDGMGENSDIDWVLHSDLRDENHVLIITMPRPERFSISPLLLFFNSS